MSGEVIGGDRTNGRWSKEEHEKFMLGLQLYGKNWKKIQALIVTRNGSQIRSHAQKFFQRNNPKKTSINQDTSQIQDPQIEYQPKKQPEKKQKKKLPTPQFSSHAFWSQISTLITDPQFSVWDLIDHPHTNNEDKKFPPLKDITQKMNEIEIENGEKNGFNIFIPAKLNIS